MYERTIPKSFKLRKMHKEVTRETLLLDPCPHHLPFGALKPGSLTLQHPGGVSISSKCRPEIQDMLSNNSVISHVVPNTRQEGTCREAPFFKANHSAYPITTHLLDE